MQSHTCSSVVEAASARMSSSTASAPSISSSRKAASGVSSRTLRVGEGGPSDGISFVMSTQVLRTRSPENILRVGKIFWRTVSSRRAVFPPRPRVRPLPGPKLEWGLRVMESNGRRQGRGRPTNTREERKELW